MVTTGSRQIVRPRSVNGDEAVHKGAEKNSRDILDQIRTVAMAGNEIEIASLQKMVFDAAHDGSGIALTHFRHNHADRKAPLRA
jgi:hypothetical protein